MAIARALAMNPMMLLLDEPTSGLDESRIGQVLQIINELSRTGVTMLLITHNLRFSKQTGHRFGLLRQGSLQVSDNPALLDSLQEDWL